MVPHGWFFWLARSPHFRLVKSPWWLRNESDLSWVKTPISHLLLLEYNPQLIKWLYYLFYIIIYVFIWSPFGYMNVVSSKVPHYPHGKIMKSPCLFCVILAVTFSMNSSAPRHLWVTSGRRSCQKTWSGDVWWNPICQVWWVDGFCWVIASRSFRWFAKWHLGKW